MLLVRMSATMGQRTRCPANYLWWVAGQRQMSAWVGQRQRDALVVVPKRFMSGGVPLPADDKDMKSFINKQIIEQAIQKIDREVVFGSPVSADDALEAAMALSDLAPWETPVEEPPWPKWPYDAIWPLDRPEKLLLFKELLGDGVAFGAKDGFNELGCRLPLLTMQAVPLAPAHGTGLRTIREAAKLVDAIAWANTGSEWLDSQWTANMEQFQAKARGQMDEENQSHYGNLAFLALYSQNMRVRDQVRNALVAWGLEDDT